MNDSLTFRLPTLNEKRSWITDLILGVLVFYLLVLTYADTGWSLIALFWLVVVGSHLGTLVAEPTIARQDLPVRLALRSVPDILFFGGLFLLSPWLVRPVWVIALLGVCLRMWLLREGLVAIDSEGVSVTRLRLRTRVPYENIAAVRRHEGPWLLERAPLFLGTPEPLRTTVLLQLKRRLRLHGIVPGPRKLYLNVPAPDADRFVREVTHRLDGDPGP